MTKKSRWDISDAVIEKKIQYDSDGVMYETVPVDQDLQEFMNIERVLIPDFDL